MKRTILITGGAGFIGSHVVRLFVNKYPGYRIINVDKLTYAGNLANLEDIEDYPNYRFVKMDICDFDAICQLMKEENLPLLNGKRFLIMITRHFCEFICKQAEHIKSECILRPLAHHL